MFIIVFSGLIVGAITLTFLKYYVFQDYFVSAQADCDPNVDRCFVHRCYPETDGECPEDPVSYYKQVRKKAKLIPLCNPNDGNCDALTCAPDTECEVTFCDESNVPPGELCSDPTMYQVPRQEGGFVDAPAGPTANGQEADPVSGSGSDDNPNVSNDTEVST